MNVIESVLKVTDDETTVRLSCGHNVLIDTRFGPTVRPGSACGCIECGRGVGERRTLGPDLPHPDNVLDALVEDYVTTIQAQGHIIGPNDRVAIRRAANIQYAWYCAFKRVLM